MKYEQDDLLEKFIQNEKRSKMWALLSVIAFTLVAVTVVYVAKEIKGKTEIIHDGSVQKAEVIHDTLIVPKNDPKVAGQLKQLTESNTKLQIRLKELKIYYDSIERVYENGIAEVEKLRIINKECTGNTGQLKEEIERLKILLKECGGKTGNLSGGDPVSKKINVTINYSPDVPDTTVMKLRKLLSRNKNINVTGTKLEQGTKPAVMYFNSADAKMAEAFSAIINNPSLFRTRMKYMPYLNSTAGRPAGNFEIRLTNIY